MLYKSVYRRRHRTAMSGWQPIPHTSQIHITGGHISEKILFFFQLQFVVQMEIQPHTNQEKTEGHTWRIVGKLVRPLPAQNPDAVASRRPYYLFCTSGQTRQKDETKVNDKEKHIWFQAEGKPDPEILWFKHDAPVTQSSSVKVSFSM